MVKTGRIASLEHANILKGPFQVAFDITNRCNFRCLHCYNLSGENLIIEDEMSDREVLSFIDDVAAMELQNFCFCGGEPLLRKKLLFQCAEILRSKDTKHVSLVTNGYFVDETTAKDVISSGVSRVQVSIDGADAATHERLRGQKGAFDRALKAIDFFLQAGAKELETAFCPTSFNVYQIRQMHSLCKKLGVIRMRVQPLMFLGRANDHLNDLAPSFEQYRQLVREIYSIQQEGLEPNIEWGDPVDHLIRFRTLCEHCVTYVSIKANGGVTVSPYLPLVVGNVRRHKLSDYWEAGLPRIWELQLVKDLAERIRSIPDYNKREEGVPHVWREKDMEIELMNQPITNKKAG